MDHLAVAHVHGAVGVGGGFGVVGDEDDGLAQLVVELAEHAQDGFGILGVEIAGGLVGEEDFRFGDDGAGDGDALLLAAGESGRLVVEAVAQAEQVDGDVEAVGVEAVALDLLRQDDVAAGGEAGEEVEALEDEADGAAAKQGAVGVAHLAQVVAVDPHDAGGGRGEAAEDVEQRGLAAARGAHDGHYLAFMDFEVHPAQGRDFDPAGMVNLPQVVALDDRFQLRHLL